MHVTPDTSPGRSARTLASCRPESTLKTLRPPAVVSLRVYSVFITFNSLRDGRTGRVRALSRGLNIKQVALKRALRQKKSREDLPPSSVPPPPRVPLATVLLTCKVGRRRITRRRYFCRFTLQVVLSVTRPDTRRLWPHTAAFHVRTCTRAQCCWPCRVFKSCSLCHCQHSESPERLVSEVVVVVSVVVVAACRHVCVWDPRA